MKKTTTLTKLFIAGIALSTSLFLSDQAQAETPDQNKAAAEKLISESSQKLTQLKAVKLKSVEQKTEAADQLSYIGMKIQKTQTAIKQLQDIQTIGSVTESATAKTTDALTLDFASVTAPKEETNDPLDEKKERLAELNQQQKELQTEIRELTEEQSDLADQEKQLSKKIEQAKQQQAEQSKQTDTRSAVIAAAKTHLGKPYVYGAAGPDAFDCSGLVQVAFASIGHALGRTTVDQETAGTTIAVSEAQAGDLVFWGSHGGTYHVGISTGDGSYIHAPVPGDVVQIATVASYSPDFAVRVL
ncbi:C40 family peptidase [Enterococcus sp. DIV0242_7C1]|uniref:Peptidoglycan DL-endopeptidase CwlO n=1 Tax=Candidatus Enterococcus dunnyi TaxID=1834192 RepID=A0A200J7Z2_9ENTE|nr:MULTISPECIES: C40 family peptidase [unclassified Enterococcus]MBO0470899.1 C40 family peptidase [Enterococcus sp. DIV0242_7C1]OUZ33346.1 hypothetical protein A5889_002057 [Enterococcus sp. 9D6_DIV0238]